MHVVEPVDTIKGSWINYLNAEAEDLLRLSGALDHGLLRRVLTESLEENFNFPFKAVFRGYVLSSRSVHDGAIPSGLPQPSGPGSDRYLEVVPAGYTEEAFEIMGGILVPCERDLHPGSVVTMAVAFADPSSYFINPPGILADLVDLDVEVAVEP